MCICKNINMCRRLVYIYNAYIYIITIMILFCIKISSIKNTHTHIETNKITYRISKPKPQDPCMVCYVYLPTFTIHVATIHVAAIYRSSHGSVMGFYKNRSLSFFNTSPTLQDGPLPVINRVITAITPFIGREISPH